MKHTSELLEYWLRDWDDRFGTFKEPKLRELLFDRSFTNVCHASVIEIEEHHLNKLSKPIQRSSTGWIGGFLRLLESAFDDNSPVVDDLRLEYPQEMKDLQSELKARAFDLTHIYPLLKTIRNGLSPRVIGREMMRQFRLDGRADVERIRAMSTHLVRSQLGVRSHHELKDLPKNVISRLGAKYFLGERSNELVHETELSKELWEKYCDLLMVKAENERSNRKVVVVGPTNVYERLKTYFWRNLVRSFLDLMVVTLKSEILTLGRGRKISEIAGQLERDSDLHRRVGDRLLPEYVNRLVRAAVHSLMAQDARDSESELSTVTLKLGDWLINHIHIGREPGGGKPHRPGTVDRIATEAFSYAAADGIALYAAEDLVISMDTNTATSIGRRICCLLARDISGIDLGRIDSPSKVSEFLNEWSARVDIHRNLGAVLFKVDDAVVVSLPDTLAARKIRLLLGTKKKRKHHWATWRDSFVRNAGATGYVYKYFPWSRLTSKEIEGFFESVFAEFELTLQEWSVWFTVYGLDSKEELWKMGGITFYDPSAYDFRDVGSFASKSDKATTLAKVDVKARSTFDASRIAWNRLTPVLDNFGFVLSLNKTYGGFAIEVDRYIFVEHSTRQTARGGQQLHRGETAIQQPVDAVKSWVAPVTDRLMEKVRKGSKFTELEQRFSSAVHWYNKGRWQKDPADTYLFYWIGIETLFDGASQADLFPQMSLLSVNWQTAYGYGWYFLSRHWRDLVKMVKRYSALVSAIESEPKLKNWDRKYTTLLDHQNAQLLIDLIPKQSKKVNEYAAGYRDHLMKFVTGRPHYEREVGLLRDEYRFKLYLLKTLRNDVTHGGVHEHPSFVLFSNELQDVFEDLLHIVGNTVINVSAKYKTMADLLKEVDIWWVK